MWRLVCRVWGHRVVWDECRRCASGERCCWSMCRPCLRGWCWVCHAAVPSPRPARLVNVDSCACNTDPDRPGRC